MTQLPQTSTINPTTQPKNSKQPISKLWYKNYMVWIFVIGLPVVVVIACIFFIIYSVQIKDSVVRDDWYMDGKTLYADVSKDKLAHDLGLNGAMHIQKNQVNFQLHTPPQNFSMPNELKVEISHATQVQKDRDFTLKHSANGNFSGTVELDQSAGKYYIIVHNPENSWRLRSVQTLPTDKKIDFKPLTSFDEN